jgi:hypothetical protein
MAMIASHHGDLPRKEWTPQVALRYAWYAYLTMLALPFFVFLYALWSLLGRDRLPPNVPLSNAWFVTAVAFIVLASPAAFFMRSRYFRAYYQGDCVAPRAYLKGMAIVWVTLEIGGLYALIGALASQSLLPNFLVALAPFVMFVVLWPSGRAMVANGRGASEDPERYEEPR